MMLIFVQHVFLLLQVNAGGNHSFYLWWLERVIGGEVDCKKKNSSLIRTVTLNVQNISVSKIFPTIRNSGKTLVTLKRPCLDIFLKTY